MQSAKAEKSSNSPNAEHSGSSSPPQAEDAKLVDSKRLKLLMSCITSYKENFVTDLRETLAEIYGPVYEDNPPYVEKILNTCEGLCMKGFDKKLSKFIESNELDKKLKELEEIADEPVPGVEKAWRPTGLTAMQQQLARDTEVLDKCKDKLAKELETEEAELRELMEKARKYREQYQQYQEKLDTLKIKANALWDESEQVEEALSSLDIPDASELLK